MSPYLPIIVAIALVVLIGWRRFSPVEEVEAPDAEQLHELADSLIHVFVEADSLEELLEHETFLKASRILDSLDYSDKDLLNLSLSGKPEGLSWLASMALCQREPDQSIAKSLIANLNVKRWALAIVYLQPLARHAPSQMPTIGRVTVALHEAGEAPKLSSQVRKYIKSRIDGGEDIMKSLPLKNLAANMHESYRDFLVSLTLSELAPLYPEISRKKIRSRETLTEAGTIWGRSRKDERDPIVEDDATSAEVEKLSLLIRQRPSRSIMLIGEPGAGKRTMIELLGMSLQDEGWEVFEAGEADLMAGQKYFGEYEQRLADVCDALTANSHLLWVVPRFETLLTAGKHAAGGFSTLDLILPLISRGEITIAAELTSQVWGDLIKKQPKLTGKLEVVRLSSMSEERTLDLASKWLRKSTMVADESALPQQTLKEIQQLAMQYMDSSSNPGRLMSLLKQTLQTMFSVRKRPLTQVRIDDFIYSLSNRTGIPESILDERKRLDLDDLGAFFLEKVQGQSTAIECLIERVAMIKAGVTDPSRPYGVFLFAGPTGTGKTELAKRLAEYLFGAQDRLIRLDMSEFQSAESLSRLFGNDQEDRASLISKVEQQPFSVLLLDEIEKANSQVWDLFLQIFDDGRLSNNKGQTADFRHCIIVMTSNLGSSAPGSDGLGFRPSEQVFQAAKVERAISDAFRPEFINRLDRVIVFNPLSREVMKGILSKEIDDVFQRRGLRNREWALVWDSSATEFLLDAGFSPTMGARPLKRAVEQHLLAPLSQTIVRHQAPEGEQFLHISSSGEKLKVEFIDPDQPYACEEETSTRTPIGDMTLEHLILRSHGTQDEIQFLQGSVERLKDRITSDDWQDMKTMLMEEASRPGFWEREDRYGILGKAEYLDRIESSIHAAADFHLRLSGGEGSTRSTFDYKHVCRIAQSCFLVETALRGLDQGNPHDAYLRLESMSDSGKDRQALGRFAERLGRMYKCWANARRMRYEVLKEVSDKKKGRYELVMTVSGLGAYTLLKTENGLHSLEISSSGKGKQKCMVRVSAIPQPQGAPRHTTGGKRQEAERAFSHLEATSPELVRVYCEEPSPLVRDRVRGFRTGNLESVLDGNFDIIASYESSEAGSAG